MAVVFVFFLTLFGLAFYRFAETDIDLVGSDRNAMAALYAAQAGLEKASWIAKNHRAIEEGSALSPLNPFTTTFYSEDGPLMENFQQVAHDNQAFLSPGGNELPRYFRINWVDARGADEPNPNLMTCVRVQVLGAVDVDGDGEGGLNESADSQGFPIDLDDVNRKFEAIIGLPGSLAENLSAGAPAFNHENGTVNFITRYEQLRTQDGYDVPQESGFLYYQLGGLAGWDQYGYIFGRPIRQGEIELPPGLFDGDGIVQLSYFSGLDLRQYEGDQIFDRENDPTSGQEGRDIVYVNGDVWIQDVDFGRLDSGGAVRGCDWERTDVTIICTGTITARDIQCGNVGRLIFIARDILLVGDYDTRINGIVLAGRTITLDDQETAGEDRGCEYGVLKNAGNPSEPIRYTAYFMGTMLAGNSINLRNAGWTVLFDEKVINGLIYDEAMSKPTLVYETAENEDGDFPYDKWREVGGELDAGQETYTSQEIADGVAASWDQGGDDSPNLMRIDHDPDWQPASSPNPDRHDYGIYDGLQLDFSPWQDWTNYRALTFWMSLDNWKEVSGSRETARMFYFKLRAGLSALSDGHFPLDKSPPGYYDTIDDPGDGAWKKVRIPLTDIDPTSGFDVTNVAMIRFIFEDFELSWYDPLGTKQWIDYDTDPKGPNPTDPSDPDPYYYGVQGKFVFHDGVNEHPVRFKLDSGKYKFFYTDSWGVDHDIQWNDPNVGMVPLYFEDQFNPNLRIDQIQVPGKPASNPYLEYGLPQCFRYAVTHLREYKTF